MSKIIHEISRDQIKTQIIDATSGLSVRTLTVKEGGMDVTYELGQPDEPLEAELARLADAGVHIHLKD